MRLESFGKINLFLEVIGKRPDGFHELSTVMQTVSVADRITIERADGIDVIADAPGVPDGEANIAWRAARLLQHRTGTRDGCTVRIEKGIPAAAGLGGGSGNAAAVLAGLSRLWGLGLSSGKLARIGAEIGSDVPFFFQGGACLCEGRGEKVTPLLSLPGDLRLLVVTPRLELSAASIYNRIDRFPAAGEKRPVQKAPVEPGGDPVPLLNDLFNRLEEAVMISAPEIQQVKTRMERYCVSKVIVSGSGPTLIGLLAAGNEGCLERSTPFEDCRFAAVVHPVGAGFRFVEETSAR